MPWGADVTRVIKTSGQVTSPTRGGVHLAATRWIISVEAAVRAVPRAQLQAPARESMAAVASALGAAADAEGRVAAGRTAAHLARDAGVGDRVWQKRTQWLRENGWLRRGPGGPTDGWLLCSPE